jgi:hypothetical protein
MAQGHAAFNDTNICQRWARETVGHSEKNTSHSILKKDNQNVLIVSRAKFTRKLRFIEKMAIRILEFS